METSKLYPWVNYEFQPGFILGFHGCDREVGEAILQGKTQHLTPSANDYDWLGTGKYEVEQFGFVLFKTLCTGSPPSRG